MLGQIDLTMGRGFWRLRWWFWLCGEFVSSHLCQHWIRVDCLRFLLDYLMETIVVNSPFHFPLELTGEHPQASISLLIFILRLHWTSYFQLNVKEFIEKPSCRALTPQGDTANHFHLPLWDHSFCVCIVGRVIMEVLDNLLGFLVESEFQGFVAPCQ